MQFKTYTKIFTLTANQESSQTITIEEGYSFEVTELFHTKTGACDITALKVSDEDILTGDATSIDNVMSGTTRRVPLMVPIVVPTRKQITIKLKDTSAAANTVKVAVHGIKKVAGA